MNGVVTRISFALFSVIEIVARVQIDQIVIGRPRHMIHVVPTAYHGIRIGFGAFILPCLCWWRRLIGGLFFIS